MRTEVMLETWKILQLFGMANSDRWNINFTWISLTLLLYINHDIASQQVKKIVAK